MYELRLRIRGFSAFTSVDVSLEPSSFLEAFVDEVDEGELLDACLPLSALLSLLASLPLVGKRSTLSVLEKNLLRRTRGFVVFGNCCPGSVAVAEIDFRPLLSFFIEGFTFFDLRRLG